MAAHRLLPGLVALAALASAVGAHEEHGGAWPPANHSPHVFAFLWEPIQPARGQAVQVHAVVLDAENLSGVLLRVCRVQAYSCLAPAPLAAGRSVTNATGARLVQYDGALAWDGRFLESTTNVGLGVLLRHVNGTQEESPVDHWPERPADLPADGGRYYYYDLPAPARGAPGVSAFVALGVLLAALARLGRRA